MRYVIFGGGAVGGVMGARLFQAGHDVVLIARGPHLDAIRNNGLRFETPDGSETLHIPAKGHPSDLNLASDDAVLLTMKAQHTQAALGDLRAAAPPGIRVICAQNGVENERIALRQFEHVYAMLVILPATHLTPGVVQASAAPVSGVLDTGRYPSGTDAFITRVAADLDSAGLSSRAVAEPMRLKYAKLLMNLGNALQAACEPDPVSADLHRRARDEALACYRAAGIDWASDAEMDARRAAMSRLRPIAGQSRTGGSSWQSIARGAGSIESDYLNGEIVLLGRLHGVATPVNAALQEIGERMVRERLAPQSIPSVAIERMAAIAGGSPHPSRRRLGDAMTTRITPQAKAIASPRIRPGHGELPVESQ